MQVTAAHEMLHGAYERLSDADRKRVDAMLTDYYEHGLTDQRVRETIEAYKKSEPKDVVNEMHSVFGTEIANLPANLEHYYTRYFDDRAKVAAFAAQYQAQFTGRKQQIDQYDAQLTTLKNQIDAMETDLQSKQQQINTLQAQLNGQRRSGDVNSYNAGVPGYNSLVNEYNTEIQTAKSLIQQYNDLVKQRNAVAFEEDQLVKSLSTDALPAQ
jgi:chromosome segregation ATPase